MLNASPIREAPETSNRWRRLWVKRSTLVAASPTAIRLRGREVARTSEVSGWDAVTPGTVEETASTGLIDTPALQHVFNASWAVIGVLGRQKLIMSGIVRFLDAPRRYLLLAAGPVVNVRSARGMSASP
jgi:hypothetical protein